jgi:hypothetical protein
VREVARPAAVAHWVDFHPDLSLPLVQLQGAVATGDPEVPVTTPGAPCEFAFPLDDESVPAACLEGLPGSEFDIQDKHGLHDRTASISASLPYRRLGYRH